VPEIGQLEEFLETIYYAPGLRDSGDLEPATKLITATSEASGLVNADYSASLTLPKSPDARLVVTRVATRLKIEGSVLGSPYLRCRVYIDAQDADHMVFDVTVGTSTSFFAGAHFTTGTVFELITDGEAHTFYFFLWDPNYSAGVNEYTVSLARLWEWVGVYGTTLRECLSLNHDGFVVLSGTVSRWGTGTAYLYVYPSGRDIDVRYLGLGGTDIVISTARVVHWVNKGACVFALNSTVATDITYFRAIHFVLRSVR